MSLTSYRTAPSRTTPVPRFWRRAKVRRRLQGRAPGVSRSASLCRRLAGACHPVLRTGRTVKTETLKWLSDLALAAGFPAAAVLLIGWFPKGGRDRAHAERLAIFVGLWGPACSLHRTAWRTRPKKQIGVPSSRKGAFENWPPISWQKSPLRNGRKLRPPCKEGKTQVQTGHLCPFRLSKRAL
jgi:hypothetical protein